MCVQSKYIRYLQWECRQLLEGLATEEVFDCPEFEFVPKVEMLKEALQSAPLSLRAHAMLMQHHERTGEFAKAENALFAMLDAEPDNGAIVEFGVGFYKRMLEQSNTALADGGLPRAEVEEGLNEFLQRSKRSHTQSSQ